VLVYLAVRDRSPSSGPGQPPVVAYGPAAPVQGGYGPTYTGQPEGQQDGGYDEPPPWLPPAPAPYQPPTPKRGPLLFGPTLALVAVALGALGMYDVWGGSVTESAYPALALAVVGGMLVVGAFVGRAGGLILLGMVAALALAVTSAVSAIGGWDGDGERLSVTPTSAAGVRSDYSVKSGRVFVDLSEVRDPQALDGRVIDVHAKAGELVVVLPDGIRSEVDADIDGPGQIDLPDHARGGINSSLDETYGSGPAGVTITTHLSVGHIDVRNP
jgi:hypothetical protein